MTEFQPLSERLRPRQLEDLALPRYVTKKLQRMLDAKDPMNMVFHGPPGTGKTSAARIFLQAWDQQDTLLINGAMDTGINHVRDLVRGFAVTPFRIEELRLCFIDEADHLSSSAQASLRVIIEQTVGQCRFILAVNERSKLSEPLRSRLHAVDFTVRGPLDEEVKQRLLAWYSNRLSELELNMGADTVAKIVTLYFPDFRRIANALEFGLR